MVPFWPEDAFADMIINGESAAFNVGTKFTEIPKDTFRKLEYQKSRFYLKFKYWFKIWN